MKNIINLFLIIVCFFATSCQGTKDALQGKSRGERSDEFLVQKKSPLLMPPDYNELPNPKLETDPETLKENSDIKELIVNSDQNNNSSLDKDKPSENFEKLFLEKIKKN